ncbi:hypothetical protein HYR54_04020 [Candidatus Acetothermia bacterium]|nr:hypothetical protein [Candidatus Acetothermia bacterium]
MDLIFEIVLGLFALTFWMAVGIVALAYLAHLHGESEKKWDKLLHNIGWHQSKGGNRDRE